MILTKDELVRRLDGIGADVSAMGDMLVEISEHTRPVDAIETDAWCSLEWGAERLSELAAKVESLRRDVLADL